MNNKIIDKKIKYLTLAVIVLSLSIIGVSVAYYLARISGNLSGRAAGIEMTLNIEKLSTSANEDLIPLDNTVEMLGKAILGYGNTGSFDSTKSCIDKNGRTVCQIYKITVRNNGTVPLDITGGVQLVGANTPNIDCAVMNTNSTITNNNTCIGANTLANDETLSARSSKDYYIIVYINNLHQTQYDSGSFNGTISFVSTQGKRVKARFNDTYTAANYLTDKYNSDQSKINVDASDEVQYRYATTELLMYDRLEGTSTNLEEGNLRFYGENPNNFIDIGDRTVTNNTQNNWEVVFGNQASFSDTNGCLEWMSNNNVTDDQVAQLTEYDTITEFCSVTIIPANSPILWRIIGVFDGNLKIIRYKPIGNYSWDTSASDVNDGKGINDWNNADIMKLLNPGYESNTDKNSDDNNIMVNNSLYWNSESGTCYNDSDNTTTTCDFTNNGLSNETKDLIVDNNWDIIIQNEVNYDKEKWTGKVGLPDIFDYKYGADLKNCTNDIKNYYNSPDCSKKNWIFPVNGENAMWSMSVMSEQFSNSSVIAFGGNHLFGQSYLNAGVYPSVYLKKDLVIESGTGTIDDPYIAG